jgi:glycosyltransferase involved in cell wall biosynthesis
MSRPLVSVCLPSHNYAEFLRSCLDSVWGQTFPDFELVVVDDSSSDGSADIIRSYHDPRLRLIRHAEQAGAVPTWNHCLELAQGQYVSYLCADDVFLPDKLERQIVVFESTPEVSLVHANGYWAGADGVRQVLFSSVFPSELQAHLSTDYVTPAPLEVPRLAAGYNYVHLSSAMFRRSTAVALAGFSPRFPYAADWDLWLRLAERGVVGYVACPLAAYRRHDRNLTRAMQRSGQDFRDWYGVVDATFRRWPRAAGEPDPFRREALRVICEHLLARVHACYAQGDNQAVRRDLRLAFRHEPRLLLDSLTVATYIKSYFGGRRLRNSLSRR